MPTFRGQRVDMVSFRFTREYGMAGGCDVFQRTRETARGEWREMLIPMDRPTEIYIRYDSADGPQDNVKQYIRANFPLTE